ncbi:MAG: TolC family protein [Vicingaceae bacterium]
MKARFLLISLALATAIYAQDNTKSSFSLIEAQAYAIEHHLNIQNAKLEWEESKKRVQETTAIGLPQINASADYKYYTEIPITAVDATVFDPTAPAGETVALEFGVNNNGLLNLTANQLLFDGTFIVGLQAASTYKQLKEQGIRLTEIQVKNLVAKSYYNVLIAESTSKIYAENVEKLETQLSEMEEMFKVGLMEEIEVDQLSLILSDAIKRKQTIDRQIAVSYQLLNFQMGREIDANLELTDDLKSIYNSYDESALLSSELTVDRHIDFQMLETQEKLQMLLIRKDQASRLPTIGAAYSLGYNSFVSPLENNLWYRNQYIGVNISMPIFTSTMNSSKVQQGKIALDRIKNNKSILEDNLKIEIAVARAKYIDALDQFKTEEKNLLLSQKIFDITRTKQKNGLASSLEVTVSNNQYLEVQGRYIQALYSILDAKASLDKALNNY